MKTPRAKDTLKRLEVRPSKKRGQNFLIDPSVISSIIEFGNPSSSDTLVEIGPGLGALTENLVRIAPLSVIEIEQNFCDDLARRFPSLNIVSRDVRTVDFSVFGKGLLVFGNLPYSLSTDIVFHLISQASSIKRAILLLQREFAERMAASPGGRDYGVLSISCQMAADLKLGPVVKGNCFHPPAGVESRLVELSFLPALRYHVPDYPWFLKVVKACFSQRRKKIHNSFMAAGLASREAMERAFETAGISPDCRAETLPIESFVKFAAALAVK